MQAEGSLVVEEIPLMVLADEDIDPPAVDSVEVRLVGPGERDLVAAARAVGDVGFASSGTARGDAGPLERDAALTRPQARVLDLIAEGAALVAVAVSGRDGVLATGRAMPVGDVARVYSRVGFERVGTGLVAEPPS